MTNKEAFISIVEFAFETDEIKNKYDEETRNEALNYFNNLKNNKVKNSGPMTENGKKVILWMQENMDKMTNLFTSKEAAEALFTSGRSIAGAMRKLVADGYVDKSGKDPVQYSLTEAGKTYQVDN